MSMKVLTMLQLDAIMLFDMGTKLTANEDARLKNVIHPCFAAL